MQRPKEHLEAEVFDNASDIHEIGFSDFTIRPICSIKKATKFYCLAIVNKSKVKCISPEYIKKCCLLVASLFL